MSITAVLNPADIEAEIERLDPIHHGSVILENPDMAERRREVEAGVAPAPRPLSPTRLQPVVAPEAQSQEIPDLEELLRIRAEIPRALKRRGSVDHSKAPKKASQYQPNQYKHLINKLFRRKGVQPKGEQGSETGSSSEGEDISAPPSPLPMPQTSTPIPQDYRVRHTLVVTDHMIKAGCVTSDVITCQMVINCPSNWPLNLTKALTVIGC